MDTMRNIAERIRAKGEPAAPHPMGLAAIDAFRRELAEAFRPFEQRAKGREDADEPTHIWDAVKRMHEEARRSQPLPLIDLVRNELYENAAHDKIFDRWGSPQALEVVHDRVEPAPSEPILTDDDLKRMHEEARRSQAEATALSRAIGIPMPGICGSGRTLREQAHAERWSSVAASYRAGACKCGAVGGCMCPRGESAK